MKSSQNLERSFFIFILIFISGLVIYLTRFFIITLLLSALSAAVFYPIHHRIQNKLPKKPSIAALLSVVLFCLIILIPIGILGYFVIDSIVEIAERAAAHDQKIVLWIEDFLSAVEALPFINAQELFNLENSGRFLELLQNIGFWLIDQVTGVIGEIARSIILFIVYIFSLFYFIRDGKSIIEKAAAALPLPEKDSREVVKKMLAVTRSILKSTFIIGGIQGVIGAVLYRAVGIEGYVLWGVLIMIFAAIPGIGSIVIWLPTSVVLAILGEYGRAAVVFGVGAVVIPLAELLRPSIVGEESHIHPVLVLVSVLGGIWIFGIIGILVGPIIAGAAVTIWDIFQRIYKKELDNS